MEKISKIFRDIACAAAIAVTAGFFGACSEEDNIIAEQPTGKTVHLTATLAAKGADATTRSVDASGHTAWQVGEQIYIKRYITGSTTYEVTTATVTAVNDDGSATIEADFTGVEDGEHTAAFCYPAELYDIFKYNYSIYGTQNGNLTGDNGISKLYDAAIGSGTITVSGGVASVNEKVEMDNQLCICKFHLRIGTPGDGDTFTPSTDEFPTLTIVIAGTQKIYTVTSDKPKDGGGTRGFMDGDDIYVAMEPIEDDKLVFAVSRTDDVTNETETFTMTTGKGTLTSGKFYTNIPVKMTPAVSVTIPAGGSYTLTDAVVYNVGTPAIVCEGNATIILEGDNSVLTTAVGKAAIQAGPAGTTLTIQGDGSLTVKGGKKGAAIGCGESETCGNIEITGGDISAKGDNAAGIGCGYKGTCGNITISGSTVTAKGGTYSAGIGGGNRSTCRNITISNSTVTAKGGGYSPGIGSGYGSSVCGDITISGTAGIVTKGDSAPNSIGAGKYGTCGTVTVDGVSGVIETSPYYLGDGELLRDGDVLTGTVADGRRVAIQDGATVTLRDVTINNSKNWPGITCGDNATIILEGSNTVTTTTQNYPAIMPLEGNTLTIRGTGSLTATGGRFAAGIGSGNKGTCGKITIKGGTITATSGMYGAGIGSGRYGECDDITISGGTVVAISKYDCGIGGCYCGDITITADITKVQATKLSKYSSVSQIGHSGSFTRVGTITFDTEIMHVEGARKWAITPTDGQDYGNLHLAVSTQTNENDTWTLTPVTQ